MNTTSAKPRRAFANLTEKGKIALFGKYRKDITKWELLRGLSLLEVRGEVTPEAELDGGTLAYEVGPAEVKRVVDFLDYEEKRMIPRDRAMAALWSSTQEIERIEKESPDVNLSAAQVSLNEADLVLNGESESENFDYREGWERAHEALDLAAAAELESLGQRAAELFEEGNYGLDVEDRIRSAYGEVGGLEGAIQLRRLIAELKPPAPVFRGRGHERRTA